MCTQQYCINPIFPALMEFGEPVLEANEARSWTCAANQSSSARAYFCGRVIENYDFALPDDAEGDAISQQEQRAMTAYVAHLVGMGMEYWDKTEPWKLDDCIKTIWMMSCYTHFPRCSSSQDKTYLRPCMSSCNNYIKACGVQCCDEGVQCVFKHHRQLSDGSETLEQGYSPHNGPVELCTGAAAGLPGLSVAGYVATLVGVMLPVLVFVERA